MFVAHCNKMCCTVVVRVVAFLSVLLPSKPIIGSPDREKLPLLNFLHMNL